jgi:hypothetical protein
MANFCHHCGTATSSEAHSHKPAPKVVTKKKAKRKPSAHNIAYSKAFKKHAPRFKKKSGGWKKDGFKRAGAAARKSMK